MSHLQHIHQYFDMYVCPKCYSTADDIIALVVQYVLY